MRTPHVSVVVDSYNHGRYIEAAVQSVLAQDFPMEQCEIIVVDDGSTDDTPERVRRFGDSIRYVQKPNGGQASALNLGFDLARGEIVSFLDADDLWLPGKLQAVVNAFHDQPDSGLVYHRFTRQEVRSGAREESAYTLVSGAISDDAGALLRYHIYPTSTLSFRRDVLRNLMPIPLALKIQADAFLAALAVFLAPVIALPAFLAVYQIHGQNLFSAERG